MAVTNIGKDYTSCFRWCPLPGVQLPHLNSVIHHWAVAAAFVPVSLTLEGGDLPCLDSTHNILRPPCLLIERMTKLTWPAFLEELGKLWKSGLQRGWLIWLHDLAHSANLQPVLYYLLLPPPSVSVFKVWNSLVMRSASDTAFRNAFFCFQRWLQQRGPLY